MSNPFVFKYGGYTHEAGEVWFTGSSRDAKWDEYGNLLGYTVRWELQGRKHAADAVALTAALQELERAYAIQGQDAGFWMDASTPSAHVLRSAEFVGGVGVASGINYVEGPGEYTTYRTFRFALEATTAPIVIGGGGGISGPASSFSEGMTYDFDSGTIWVPCRNAPAQRQIVTQYPLYSAVQEGSVTSLYPGLNYPPPRWPQLHMRGRIGSEPPARWNGLLQYKTTWRYEFESNEPFINF